MRRATLLLERVSTRLGRRQRWQAAREARAALLRASGELAGAPRALPYDAWPADASGAPAVVHGWYASWTDTTGLVAALVAPVPVAIDAEWCLRPRWEAARERFRAEGELARLGGEGRETVLALWCAKEALLKLARTGLADLGRCPLVACTRAGSVTRLRLAHGGTEHLVDVRRNGAHLVACAGAQALDLVLAELQESA